MFFKALEQGLNLAGLLFWAAVLIPTLIALKHLMQVSSMWPIVPLVVTRSTSNNHMKLKGIQNIFLP